MIWSRLPTQQADGTALGMAVGIQAIQRFLNPLAFDSKSISIPGSMGLSGGLLELIRTGSSSAGGVQVRSIQTRSIEDDRKKPFGWVNALVVEMIER